ncbi:MAG: hypothetical protein AAFS10_23460, partial [Myxococcota bacterium]
MGELLQDIDTDYRGETAPRDRWTVLVLTMLHPPLGYLYMGQVRAAIVAAILFVGYVAAFLVLWATLKFFPFWPALVFVAGWQLMSLMCLVGLLRDVDRHTMSGDAYVLKPYNASMVYAALFVATSLLPLYTRAGQNGKNLRVAHKTRNAATYPT